ncbi:hypothetical protein GQ457_10G013190 [Hibiscus cannabinus]
MVEQVVGFLELLSVLHCVRVEARRVFEHSLDPVLVFFQEYSVVIRIEGTPHEGVIAKSEDEEITRRSFLEYVKSYGDLLEVLLRDDL